MFSLQCVNITGPHLPINKACNAHLHTWISIMQNLSNDMIYSII